MNSRLLLPLLRLAAVVVRVVPRKRAEPVCRLAAYLWYIADPAARRAVQSNLTHVLGRRPSSCRVRAVFKHGVLNYWDTLFLTFTAPEQVLALVRLEGFEHLDQALRQGHGAIVIGAHIGSVALATQALAAHGYQMTGLVEKLSPPELLEFWTRRRRAPNLRIIAADVAGARALLTTLRQNGVVTIVSDRDVTGNGPTMRFFDAETTFPDVAAALSVRTGARILPAVAARLSDGTFAGRIEPPLEVPLAGKTKEDIRLVTQAIARRLEYHILSYPEQWTVFQPRWPHTAAREPRPE